MAEKEEMISQFKDVTGVSTERAEFFLESANWTLQVNFRLKYLQNHSQTITFILITLL